MTPFAPRLLSATVLMLLAFPSGWCRAVAEQLKVESPVAVHACCETSTTQPSSERTKTPAPADGLRCFCGRFLEKGDEPSRAIHALPLLHEVALEGATLSCEGPSVAHGAAPIGTRLHVLNCCWRC